jgi:glutamate dehydrogenase (NAD(P)+)
MPVGVEMTLDRNIGDIGGNGIAIQVPLSDRSMGYVVIDSTVENSSSGGLRIVDDITLEEVAVLAREMTLKYAFIGLSRGGAKGGLRIPVGMSPEQRGHALTEFGRRLGPVIRRGLFSPGMDMNCSLQDLRAVYSGAGLRLVGSTDTALFTAISTVESLAACREVLGSPPRRLRIAIEGFGRAAAWAALRLPPDQYVITAISTVRGSIMNEDGFEGQSLAEGRNRFGDQVVDHLPGRQAPKGELFAVETDVLIPAARIRSVNTERAGRIAARCVVPIANAPYDDGAVSILEARGVICLPGFVVNSGGVFGSSLYDAGVPLSVVEEVSARYFRRVVVTLLRMRLQHGILPTTLAKQVAFQRFRERSATAWEGSPYARAFRRLVLAKAIPWRIRSARALGRFVRNLIDLEALIEARGQVSGGLEPTAVGAAALWRG